MRLLILLVGLFLLYLFIKNYYRSLKAPPAPGQAPLAQAEDMVRCVVCGVNTPRSEAIFSGGEFFCCDEHRQARRK
ncbi:PP0621 family protein [Thiobacter aerophilum]|uniref:PP0621 family protein n=1 Tax=Thiobacter aerophilum TaxID=3121275 RepID=A0ABV0EFJ9_9BURK